MLSTTQGVKFVKHDFMKELDNSQNAINRR